MTPTIRLTIDLNFKTGEGEEMIEDLEWRFSAKENKWLLYAYDGFVWFRVPFNYEYGAESNEKEEAK